jgi:hypothetical protein
MTARSGDALSHVNFQHRSDVVFDGPRSPQNSPSTPPLESPVHRASDRSARICMAGMSGAAGTNRADSFHLNIT